MRSETQDGAPHDAEQDAPEAEAGHPADDDLRDERGDVDHDRSSHELEAMDARDALSEAIYSEPPASDAPRAAPSALLTPDRVAVVKLGPDYFFPPARDPAFLADLYRAALYLHAKGYVQPATGEAGTALWNRFLEETEKRVTPEAMDELMEVSDAWHPQVRSLIGSTIPPPPPKPKLDVSQAFLVACLGFGLGALFTYNQQKARERRAAAAQPQAALSMPTVRPPYNPDKHGSLEEYRAAFAHLPSPLDARDPDVIGLDRSAWNVTPYTSASQENSDREAAERKRRGW